LTIITINPLNDKRWDDYILHHSQGTIFHHSCWARVLEDRYGTPPRYYASENSQGELNAIAPFFLVPGAFWGHRLVCLPCSEYCFPLANDPSDLEKLLLSVEAEVNAKKISFLEIRGISHNLPVDRLSLKAHPYYLNHVASLQDSLQDFKARLSRDTRYHLNRGERSQVSLKITQNEYDLKRFHRLTSDLRRRINLLPWPYRFFHSIFRHVLLTGYGFLLLAEYKGEVISGGIFFEFKDTILNKFNASDARFIQLRPNYLVMWKAIEYAYQKSYRNFDFGLTNPENSGLINFKKHWNTAESVLPYYYYPEIRGVSSLPQTSLFYKTHTRLNQLLPGFAHHLAAEIFYKRLG